MYLRWHRAAISWERGGIYLLLQQSYRPCDTVRPLDSVTDFRCCDPVPRVRVPLCNHGLKLTFRSIFAIRESMHVEVRKRLPTLQQIATFLFTWVEFNQSYQVKVCTKLPFKLFIPLNRWILKIGFTSSLAHHIGGIAFMQRVQWKENCRYSISIERDKKCRGSLNPLWKWM